jgi:hypothetical protein
MPASLSLLPCLLCETCPHCSLGAIQLSIFSFNELKLYPAIVLYMYRLRCAQEGRGRAGRGIHGGSAELEGGATVYLYSIEAFALAIVVHYTSF